MTQCFYYSLDKFFDLFKLWPESVGGDKITNLSAKKTREKKLVEMYVR
jgi:hypothetical protein